MSVTVQLDNMALLSVSMCRPEGVRGRNSDNDMIKECLGWAPTILLKDGLTTTYKWIKEQLDAEVAKGVDIEVCYGTSKVVAQNMASDDQEGKNVRADAEK